MPVFNDSENIPAVLPEGDYSFCIVGMRCKISAGKTTAGCEVFEMDLEMEPSNKGVMEFLIDHKSCLWKWDVMLKSCGVKLQKGEPYDLRKEVATQSGIRWINPIGLRGWCRLIQEPSSRDPKRMFNRVAVFYTDRPKLEPREIETSEEDTPF